MSEATGLKAGLCPHSQDPITICDICLLRRADKVRLAEERGRGAAREVQGRRNRGNRPQGIQVLPIRFQVGDTKGQARRPAPIPEPPRHAQGVSRGQPKVAQSLRSRAWRRTQRARP